MGYLHVCRGMEITWMQNGTCNEKSADTFFPGDGVGVEKAKKICQACPVKDTCLEYALKNRVDHGVWGGTSERQRRRILRARKVEAQKIGVEV